MQAEGGAAGFVDIVARLLAATFGGRPVLGRRPPAEGSSAVGACRTPRRAGSAARGGRTRPFPWDDVMAAGLGLLRLPPAAFLVHDPTRARSRAPRPPRPLTPTRPCPAPRSPQLMSRFPD